MHNFNPHEAFTDDARKHQSVNLERATEQAREDEKRKENMLQMGWLAHRIEKIINNESALQMRLQELALSDPSISERIERAVLEKDKDEMLQTIIFENMLADSEEARWFRVYFPSGRKEPLAPDVQLILDSFDDDPDSAYGKLDHLFSESIRKQ